MDTQRRYVCDDCGRRYKQKGGLLQHQRYECGKEPQFSCPHCPYKAKRKTNLQSHILFKHQGFKNVNVKSSNE